MFNITANYGFVSYNFVIAPTSGLDLFFEGQNVHEKNWTEIEASTYAYYFFGLSNNLMSSNTNQYLKENTIDTTYGNGGRASALTNQYLNYSYFGKK